MPFRQRNTERARELRRNATPAEQRLWQALKGQKTNAKFCRQMPVGPYYADFLCRSHNLIIEIDGQPHDQTVPADQRRTAVLNGLGFTVVRFTNEDVMHNLEGVVPATNQALLIPPASGRGDKS